MNNMTAYCIGMADYYEGPIEDEQWLGIPRTQIPGAPELSKRLIENVLNSIDVAYAEEWRFDHGISVPLHFMTPRYDLPVIPVNINCQGPPLTPLHRAREDLKSVLLLPSPVPLKVQPASSGIISRFRFSRSAVRLRQWELTDRQI